MVKVVINRTTTKVVRSAKTRTIRRIQRGDPGIIRLVWNEIPTGLINGVNNSFTLTQAPVYPKIMLFVRGVKQTLGNDFTLATNTITFNVGSIPTIGSQLEATYEY